MMSLMEQQRMRVLERKLEELEARIAVVERADSFENSDVIVPRRRPGRPRKVETEASPAT